MGPRAMRRGVIADVWRTARVTATSESWRRFRARHELEWMNESTPLIARPIAGLAGPLGGGPAQWEVYVATDPPVKVGTTSSLDPPLTPVKGEMAWTNLSLASTTDPRDAARGARALLNAPTIAAPSQHRIEDGECERGSYERRAQSAVSAKLYFGTAPQANLQKLLAWTETVQRELFQPVIDGYERGPVVYGIDTDRASVPPYALNASVLVFGDGGKGRRLPANAEGWDQLRVAIADEATSLVVVEMVPLNGEGGRSRFYASAGLQLVLRPMEDVERSTPFELGLRIPVMPEGLGDLQALVLRWLGEALTLAAAYTGWVDVNSSQTFGRLPSDEDPWARERFSRPLPSQDLTQTIRGIHWGTYLGAAHLAALDAAGVDLQSHFAVEPAGTDPSMVLLRLSERLEDLDAGIRTRAEALLGAILPLGI